MKSIPAAYRWHFVSDKSIVSWYFILRFVVMEHNIVKNQDNDINTEKLYIWIISKRNYDDGSWCELCFLPTHSTSCRILYSLYMLSVSNSVNTMCIYYIYKIFSSQLLQEHLVTVSLYIFKLTRRGKEQINPTSVNKICKNIHELWMLY